jgi:hypothetical protein
MMVQLKSPLHAARCGALAKSNAGATTPVCSYGLDWSWADHPLHRSTISLTATINGASVSLNSQLVLPEVLRMVDYKKNRSQRTCPSAMSRFADNNDSLGAVCDPMGTFSSAADEAELGNGAYTQWGFCDGTGTPLSGNGTYVSGGITVAYTNGIPTVTATQLAYPIFVYLDTTEKVMVSPFVFADAHEFKEQGLSGISQFQLTMQMRDPASARIVQQRSAYSGTVLSAINYQATPFSTSYIQATFLMPAVGQAPPVKCTVPYMDWNPQVSPATAVAAGAVSQQLTSNACVLQNVPDYLIVYAKPDFAPADLVTNPTQNEWYLPIKSVQVQWEALAPSMQAFSQAQLFAIARNNGLSMSWEQWKGQAWSSLNGGRKIQTGGGPLILRPGRDFAIGDLQAPGVVCNSNVQVSLTIANPSTLAVNAVLTLVPVYSGFFTTVGGTAATQLAPLSEADVMNAKQAAAGSTMHALTRAVGGSGLLSRLGSIVGKAKSIYDASKPYVSTAKNLLGNLDHPLAQKAVSALGAVGPVGYGSRGGYLSVEGGALAGAALAGAGHGHKRKRQHSLKKHYL